MGGKTLEDSEKRSWLYHPTLPKHWTPRSLYSMARWVNGIAFKNIQFAPVGRPVIKIAEIKGGLSDQTKFTQQVFDDSVRVRPGDLLFSWSGQPETSIDAFWWRGPEGWLNQHVFRVTPGNGIDTEFFYYLLRYLKPNFVGIARNKQTTGLGHVTKRDLENLEAAFPALPEQRAIARILGTLDDKIELNRRMAETLEAMARALFKSWFVDFEPVRAKAEGRDPGLPPDLASLFPDQLVETGHGEIPRGWQTWKFGRLAVHHRATLSPVAEPDRVFEHYSIPAHDVGQEPALDRGEAIKSNKTIVPDSAVLLSKLNPEISRVWLPKPKGDAPQIASTEFMCFTPEDPAGRALLYCLFKDVAFRTEMEAMVTGTSKSHQRISPFALLQFGAIVGSDEVFRAFEAKAWPMLNRTLSSREETRVLATLRDTLLPKLISGELRVKDAETFLERVP